MCPEHRSRWASSVRCQSLDSEAEDKAAEVGDDIGEVMDLNHRTGQWGTLGIRGEGPSEVAKGTKGWWRGAFAGKYGLGSALFSGRE